MKLSYAISFIYFAGFLDLLAVSMTIPMLSKHARALGASPSMAGLLSSVYGFIQLFSSPVVGRWSDVSGRKFVLVWCLVLSAICYATLGMASSTLLLMLARIPLGLFKHSQELSRAYLADLTPPDDHSHVFGQFNSISSLGFILGPIIGGHLADFDGGFFLLSLITAFIFFINALLVLFLIPKDKSMTKHISSTRKSQLEEFHPLAFLQSFYEVDWKNVWDIFIVRFLFSFAVLIYRSDFATTLDYKYEASAKITGYMISYSGVVGTVSGFFVGRLASKYNDDAKLLLHTGIVQMLVMSAVTFAPNVATLALLLTPLSISNAVARVCAVNLTLDRGSASQKGVLMGLGASVLSLSRMAAPAIGGLSQEFSVSGPSIVGTLVSIAGILVLVLAPRSGVPPFKRVTDTNEGKFL